MKKHQPIYKLNLSFTIIIVLFFAANGFSQQTILTTKVNPQYYLDTLRIDLPKTKQKIDQSRLAYQFAVPVEPEYTVKYPASKQKITGKYHYLVYLKAPDAYAINFSMAGFNAHADCQVFIKNMHTQKVYGPYEPIHTECDITPFPVFKNDELLIEITSVQKIKAPEVKINRVGITYHEKYLSASGACNIDINCPDGTQWQDVKKAVVKMLINNYTLCSGTLINNTSNDKTPYILTANHCVTKQREAENTVYYFNYESPECDGSSFTYPDQNNFLLRGSDLVAEKDDNTARLDFSLLKIKTSIPAHYNVYYAGWSASNNPPAKSVGIHHPGGDVKKICFDNDAAGIGSFPNYKPDSHWRIFRWDAGVTEGGSSGSALFNTNKQIVGDLTGGDATCENPVNDLYARFNIAYDQYQDSTQQLKYWLDPENLDVKSWYGWPADSAIQNTKFLVYPNPSKNKIFIFSYAFNKNSKMILYNMNGKPVWHQTLTNDKKLWILYPPEHLKGLFMLDIKTGKTSYQQKIIIK